jgi:hypothetical protein
METALADPLICAKRLLLQIQDSTQFDAVYFSSDFPDETSLNMLEGRNKSASWKTLVSDSQHGQFKAAFEIIRDGVTPIMWFVVEGSSGIRDSGIIGLLEKDIARVMVNGLSGLVKVGNNGD